MIPEKLEKLANKVLDEALEEDVSLDNRLEALKLVGGYYKMLGGVKPEDGDGGPSMDELRNRVEAAGVQ